MNLKRLIPAMLGLAAMSIPAVAQQPYGGCWHPDYVKDWTPANDPDAKFNRSTIKLQPRFVDTTTKAHEYQFPEGQVAACLTMNPMCSQTPSQGANNFIGYNPTYWQYMDLLIWWGGSAGEGIIIPPSAPVTDIAHLNGVKVLGQVFFPPTAYGGQTAWVKQMLTKEGDTYPYAKKLYEIAKYYGFDGWFINEETGGGSVTEWTEFVSYFDKCAEEDGNRNMEIQWYDQSTGIGSYTDMMKVNGASYFLNYGSASASNITYQMNIIQGFGFTKEEAFKKVYFGIEQAQGGINGNARYFQALFPSTGHAGSVDIFNPEEVTWKKVVTDYLGTDNACGETAYNAMVTVFNNEQRYWTNSEKDPSNTDSRDDSSIFPGLANAVLERSSIQSLPFVTSFSAGLGKYRFVNGEKRGTQDWYHRGMQDIMPTWRWWVDVPSANKSDLSFALNWDDAYNVGTSIKVTGKLAAGVDYLTRLYKTKIVVKSGDQFSLVYKGGSGATMQVRLATSEDNNAFTSFALTPSTTSNGWNVATVDISSLAGKTVSVIALNFASSTDIESFDLTLGQLAMLNADYAPSNLAISNLTVENQLTQDGGDIRLTWDAPESEEVHHYNVYFTQNGTTSLVGQTRNEAFYIPKFTRSSQADKGVGVAVTVVTKDMQEGSKVETEASYPDIDLPVVSLKASKTLVSVDEEVTITATATNFPESYTWTTPEGAELVSTNANEAVFKFPKEGIYNIQVAVANAVGTTTQKVDNFVEVSNSKAEKLNIVSVGKSIHKFSGSLPPEDPENLIDGVEVPSSINAKWCIGGSKEHYVVIDLEQQYTIYRFRIFDCGHKENYSDNFQNFKIWLSEDLETWTLVVDEKNRPENTKDDYIAPQVARYVKFMPYDEETPITIRIWEFEVFGLEGGPHLTLPEIQNMVLNQEIELTATYDFTVNDAVEESNFAYSVVSANPEVADVKDVVLNKTDEGGRISFKVVAKTVGEAEIVVNMTNGIWKPSKSFNVTVDDPSFTENVFIGKTVAYAKCLYYYYTSSGYMYWASVGSSYSGSIIDGDETTGVALSIPAYTANTNFTYTVDCGEPYVFGKFKLVFSNTPLSIKIYGSAEDTVEFSTTDDNGMLEKYNFKLLSEVTPSAATTTIYNVEKYASRYVKVNVILPASTKTTAYEIMGFGSKDITNDIDVLSADTEVRVYPNPVDCGGTLHINASEGASIQLVSLQGVLIKQVQAQSGSTSIQLNNVLPGTYLVVVRDNLNVKTTKIQVK